MENQNQTTEGYVCPCIGRVGEMYFDERNNRIKFLCTELQESQTDLNNQIIRGTESMRASGATRLNARFFTTVPYWVNLEARIPLNNGHSGTDFIFVGVNEPSRVDGAEIIAAENNLVRRVLAVPGHEIIIPSGYDIQRLTTENVTQNDIEQMSRLYQQAFPTYTSDTSPSAVTSLIQNTIAFGARSLETGQIVSTTVAEIANIPTSFGDFRLCELSEMATLREHRGRGLSEAISQQLVEAIRNNVDLIYAEARASHEPINRVFHNIGFDFAGRIMKQCILSGDSDVHESGPYENLNVWYMLPENRANE